MTSKRRANRPAHRVTWVARLCGAPQTGWLLATLFAALALVLCVTAYQRSLSDAVAQQRQELLDTSRLLASAIEPERKWTDEEAIRTLTSVWRSLPATSNSRPRTLSVVNAQGHVVVRVDQAGAPAPSATTTIDTGAAGDQAVDLPTIAASRALFCGTYQPADGPLQDAAFVPLSSRGWMIGIHTPHGDLVAQAQSNLQHLAWGVAIACGTLLPLSLYLLLRASRRMKAAQIETNRHLTNHQVAEAALAASEQRYCTLVETMNEGVVVEDADGVITYVNNRFCDIVGYTQDDLIGERTEALLLDTKNARILAAENIKRRDGERTHYELSMKHRDGREIPVGISPAPLITPAGRYAGSFGIITDTTKRRQAELELEQAHRRLSLHMDSSPLAVIEWDQNFVFKRWSKGATRVFGWESADTVGKDWFAFDFVSEADIPDVVAMANRLLDGIDTHHVCYTTNMTRDGEAVDCEWHNSVLFDKHKNTISFLSLIHDVTARHRAVASLRDSEERLQAIVEHMPAMLAAFDSEQRIIHWNKACERVTGYSPAEIVQDPHAMSTLYPDTDYRNAMCNEWARRGDDFHLWEWNLTCKDGSTRTIAWSNVSRYCPIPGWSSWIVGVDVTDQKLAEKERTQLAEQLRQSQKMEAVGTLATGIAHDFNNLLTAITGYADLARIASDGNEQACNALSGIDQAARQASEVTKSLLTFTRATQTRKAPVELGPLLQDSARMLRRILPASVETIVDVPDDDPVWINGDGTQLRQVVLNLAVNARDAMPDGGRLTLSARPDPRVPMPRPGASVACELGAAALMVKDTGNGMCEEVRDRIFEPFFTTKPRGQGTGLGMAVVHGIVTEHKGQILVESTPGGGTKLTILLARCAPPGETTSEISRSRGTPGHGETIVLAEDNAQVRGILTTMLSDAGYVVHAASNGVDAMQLVQRHADMVRMFIVDIELPRLGGTACIAQLRSTRPLLPIMAITGNEEFGLDTPDTDRLTLVRKPFVMSDLVDRVGEMLSPRTPKEVSSHATH